MTTLYLHIGTPKTGTTAIQHLLGENRELLRQRRIGFPDFGFRYSDTGVLRNGHFLVAPYCREDGSLDSSVPSADYEAGLRMLEEMSPEYDRIILSDEGIWNGSQHRPDFWPVLKQDLESRGFDIRIIMYLRRQDLLAQSLYVQKIKRNALRCSFGTFLHSALHRKTPFPFDYDAYVRMLCGIFGRENVIVRIFEQAQFGGAEGNLYSDFLDIFGLSLSDGFRTEKGRYNERLGKYHLELKRILNCLPEYGAERRFLLNVMQEIQDLSVPGSKPDTEYTFFQPGKQAAFCASYAESNSRLARDYFGRPDGTLFYETPENLPTISIDERELLRHLVVVYGHALDILSRQNERQDALLKKASQDIRALREDVLWYRLKRKARHILDSFGKA